MDKQFLIDFETEVKERYEAGEIKSPVHLASNNEEQLIEIFKDVGKDGSCYGVGSVLKKSEFVKHGRHNENRSEKWIDLLDKFHCNLVRKVCLQAIFRSETSMWPICVL